MDVRAVCRLITNSIRLLTLLLCVEYLDLEQLQGALAPHPRSPLGAPILTLVRLPLHYLEPLAVPRLLHWHTRAALHSYIEITGRSAATKTPGSIGTCFIDIGPV